MRLPYRDRKYAILWLQEALFKAQETGLLNDQLLEYTKDALILEWSAKMDRALGYAIFNKEKDLAIIRLSTVLWVAASEEQKRETVYHEFAHIVVDVQTAHDPVKAKVRAQQNRRSHHGSDWLRVMAILGYPNASSCHNVVNEAHERAKGKFPIYCNCRAKALDWVTRDKASRLINRFYCRKCRAPFRITPEAKTSVPFQPSHR